MNYNMDGADDNENDSEEEDWMDTQWDVIQDNSKAPDRRKESSGNGSGIRCDEGSAHLMTRMQLNDHKAGMQGLDRELINQIIYEASKGSRFFENEQHKEEQVQQKIREQEKHRMTISDLELQKGKSEADRIIAELNYTRDLSQTIVHVDMDAFYAAVEMRDNPSLCNKPMAVGGIGMLSTSNYEARKYGVRAAMPGFIGKKLCPQLVIVPTNFTKYTEVSHQVRQIFADYDANFCQMSLDEAYLNFTEHVQKRRTISVTERSFLKRCKTPAEPTSCRCDLNMTIRQSVLESEKLCIVNDATKELKDKNISANAEDRNDMKNVNENFKLIVKDQDAAHSGTVDCSSPIQNENMCTDKFAKPMSFDQIQALTGSKCSTCGKNIPDFEVVTFGVDVESAVTEMRCRIEQRTCLTASAGIAPNMMLAKVCSDQNKPNGQFFLASNYTDIIHFVQRLPIRKISGIGRVTEQLLGALGISTCSDLFEKRALLYHLYSSVSFSYFMRVACGTGSVQVARARDEDRKSMSTEQTFGELSQPGDLYSKCHELSQSLADDLAKEQLLGKTISVKLKTTDFQVRTRAQTISNYTRCADVIFSVAKGILRTEILAESPSPLHLRLMGVRISKLMNENECQQEKQDTILGFFKKTDFSSGQSSQAAEQWHSSASFSEVNQTSYTQEITDSETKKAVVTLSENLSPFSKAVTESFDTDPKLTISSSDCGHSVQSMTIRKEENNTIAEPNLLNIIGLAEINKKLVTNNMAESNSKAEDSCVGGECESMDVAVVEKCQGCQKDKGHQINPSLQSTITDIEHESQAMNADEMKLFSELHHTAVSPSQPMVPCGESGSASLTDRENSDNFNFDTHSALFGQDPAFTCPVCCKPVGCINLTDFNVHIDRCLQPEFHQSARNTQNATRKNLSSSADQVFSQTKDLQKSNTQTAKVKKAAHIKKQKQDAATSTKMKTNISDPPNKNMTTQGSKMPGTSSSVLVATNANVSVFDEGHSEMREAATESSSRSQQNSDCADIVPTDYMQCPVCGAERADWTLATFNQHVDACLNRDTISQILREQQSSEVLPQKRSASSHLEDSKTYHPSKKAKKNQSPKPACSILSFFKS